MVEIKLYQVISIAFLIVSVLGENRTFPNDFFFGVATSAYQIEGGWNEKGKGESVWDFLTHQNSHRIKDHSDGDIACDSYHKSKEDVLLIKNLGVNFYRFSVSWARILPTGFANHINEDGLNYYNDLINELVKNNIMPMITIYHWDLPLPLKNIGGWANPLLADYFTDYANILFRRFGDRVKLWITFNEPKQFCLDEYGRDFHMSGIADYLCGHTILKAHAKVYHLYQDKYKAKYNGKLSLTLNSKWFEPNSNSVADKDAAERMIQFILGWFSHPIFHKDGDYPPVMKERISNRSILEGFPKSRLPSFTKEEVEFIRGTADFFALNIYTSRLAKPLDDDGYVGKPDFFNDTGVNVLIDDEWPSSSCPWLKVVPWGARKLLKWIKQNYGNPEIIITENGFADDGELNDYKRIDFYKEYIKSILQAMNEDGVRVTGYAAWSLLDNFEWHAGYTQKFGLYHVDFKDPNRTRTMKESAKFYKKLIATKILEL